MHHRETTATAGVEMTVLLTTSSEQQQLLLLLQLLLQLHASITTTPPANAPQRNDCHGRIGEDCILDHFI